MATLSFQFPTGDDAACQLSVVAASRLADGHLFPAQPPKHRASTQELQSTKKAQ
jgi:hypothetical protein